MTTKIILPAKRHSFLAVYKSPWLYVGAVLAFIISPALAVTSLGIAVVLIGAAVLIRKRTRLAHHSFALAIGLILGSIPWLMLALQAYSENTAVSG